ncbi:MAG TPA: hypothetical protein VH372_14175 [Actinospica sp.]|nr:hypothetical protein [Actinospica sp.]
MSSNPTSTTSTARALRRSPLYTRRGRAGLAGAAVLFAALPVLAACSAGNNPEVYNIVPDNGNGKAGYMYVSNVWVVFDQSSRNAEIVGQVANTAQAGTNTNQLTGVSLAGTPATVVPPAATSNLAPGVTLTGGTVTIPGLKGVQFGEAGQPELEVPNADLTVGDNAKVTYTFSSGDSLTVTAIVEPNSGQWAQYDPNGQNSASALPSISASVSTASPTGTGASAGASVPVTISGSASPQNSVPTGTATATASGSASPSSTH